MIEVIIIIYLIGFVLSYFIIGLINIRISSKYDKIPGLFMTGSWITFAVMIIVFLIKTIPSPEEGVALIIKKIKGWNH